MKKVILKVSVLFALFSFFGIACDDDDTNTPSEFQEQEYLKFSDFGCEDIGWNLKAENIGNYYVIESADELHNHVEYNCNLDVDFNNYFVIVGAENFATGSSLVSEEVVANNAELVYTITFQKYFTQSPTVTEYHIILENELKARKIKVVKKVI